ncbi:MAG: hypothetical protein ACK5V3_15265 [Bdellovibrionales bacterium]
MKKKPQARAPKRPAPRTKQRSSPRKETTPVYVSYIASMENLSKLTKQAQIIQASSSGLLIHVKRDELVASNLRKNLNIDDLVGERVLIRLDDMNLELSGTVARTLFLGKDGFHIAVDYSEEAPEYWRECLMDLLPIPGEIE